MANCNPVTRRVDDSRSRSYSKIVPFASSTHIAKGRGKNNYQVFVVIHLLQG